MNPFAKSLEMLIPVLEKHRIKHMVIGGAALSVYGCPRFTADIDIKILLRSGLDTYSQLKEILAPVSEFLVDKPEQFLTKTNVLPPERISPEASS